jgi:TRAP-type C4-dicarboxylate transport system permease small subunit
MLSRLLASIDVVSGLLLGCVVALTFCEAALRYLFGVQIPDAYSLSGYAQGVAIFWGIASATYAGRHINVDILWDASSPKNRVRIDVFAALVCGVILAVTTYMLVLKVLRSRASYEVTNELQVSVWLFLAAATAGIAFASFVAFVRAYRLARGTLND